MWVKMEPKPITLSRKDMDTVNKAIELIEEARTLLSGVSDGISHNAGQYTSVPIDVTVMDLKRSIIGCKRLLNGEESMTGFIWE